MKILYLHNAAEISGGERSLLNLWDHLDRRRFEPSLMIPHKGPLNAAAQKLDVKVSYLDIPKLHPANCFKILRAAEALEGYLLSENIGLIHSYSPRNNILAALVAHPLKIPVIWHERNLLHHNEPDVSRRFFFMPDRIICNSQAVSRRFEDFQNKAAVILNGVNLQTFKPSQKNQQLLKILDLEGINVVGMATNLHQRKRVEFLIGLVPLVIQQQPKVKFLIIGGEFPSQEGRRLQELKDLAQKLRIQEHIVFTGFQDDVVPYLNLLDVFVHVTDKEACSRAILEAMACGKPVVAAHDGGSPELIEDRKTGFLAAVEDRHEFAQKIARLLQDQPLRQSMGQSGRTRAEKYFDVQRNARETQEVYLEFQA